MRSLLGVVTIYSAIACAGQAQQQQPAEGARELYLYGAAPKDALPPIPKKATPAAPAPAPAAALHLGLRYTLLLVSSPGDRGTPTAPDRNFRKGDCVALSLEANRSGYLYVLAKESDGNWVPLFPTPELSDQSNRIDPGQVIRTPRHACFEIEDPPGSETLFVVLSRNPRDIDEMQESIKGPGEKPAVPSGPTQIASAARINSAVDQMSQEFGSTRELQFKQVVKAPAPKAAPKSAEKKEPEQAVYVVSGSDKPASTLVTRVEIRHR